MRVRFPPRPPCCRARRLGPSPRDHPTVVGLLSSILAADAVGTAGSLSNSPIGFDSRCGYDLYTSSSSAILSRLVMHAYTSSKSSSSRSSR